MPPRMPRIQRTRNIKNVIQLTAAHDPYFLIVCERFFLALFNLVRFTILDDLRKAESLPHTRDAELILLAHLR